MAIIDSGSQISRPAIDIDEVEKICRQLLVAIGENPEREGLRETPRRFSKFWREFIEYDPGSMDTTFEAVEDGQMVVVSGIKVWSLCEHHLLPFWCNVSIGYMAGAKVLGLSKFARIAQEAAHRLQLQERLTLQIAEMVQAVTGSEDVAVFSKGQHLCMQMRGIKADSGLMTSLITRGAFNNPLLRGEFINLLS